MAKELGEFLKEELLEFLKSYEEENVLDDFDMGYCSGIAATLRLIREWELRNG